MSFDELLIDLPDEVGAALFELLQRVEKKYPTYGSDSIAYVHRCSVLQGYYEANSLEVPKAVSAMTNMLQAAVDPKADSESYWDRKFAAIKADILQRKSREDTTSTRSVLSIKAGNSFGLAVLTKEEKADVHRHIESIRKIVESSQLEDKKKNALFAKLSSLSSEVNRIGTRTDAFFGFFGDLACTVGGMAEKSKPALDEAKEILRIVLGSRAAQEGVVLPSADDFPRIMPD